MKKKKTKKKGQERKVIIQPKRPSRVYQTGTVANHPNEVDLTTGLEVEEKEVRK